MTAWISNVHLQPQVNSQTLKLTPWLPKRCSRAPSHASGPIRCQLAHWLLPQWQGTSFPVLEPPRYTTSHNLPITASQKGSTSCHRDTASISSTSAVQVVDRGSIPHCNLLVVPAFAPWLLVGPYCYLYTYILLVVLRVVLRSACASRTLLTVRTKGADIMHRTLDTRILTCTVSFLTI